MPPIRTARRAMARKELSRRQPRSPRAGAARIFETRCRRVRFRQAVHHKTPGHKALDVSWGFADRASSAQMPRRAFPVLALTGFGTIGKISRSGRAPSRRTG